MIVVFEILNRTGLKQQKIIFRIIFAHSNFLLQKYYFLFKLSFTRKIYP